MGGEGRSLFDAGNRRSGLWLVKGRSLFDLRFRRSGFVGGDRAQLFTPYPVLHKHPQDWKSSLDMKNYDV
jgi:hypothetical protein